MTTSSAKPTNDQFRLVRTIIGATATLCLLAGCFILMSPETVETWIGLDGFSLQIFGCALILVAVTDIILIKTIFKGQDRR